MMNELFEKLLKQAEERYPRHLAVAAPEIVIRKDALEYLLMLVVAECVDVCKDVDGEHNNDAICERQDCAVEIKEHFGVE